MKAGIFGELWMKRRNHMLSDFQIARLSLYSALDFYGITPGNKFGRANEYGLRRTAAF